jgi:hypothetical protein
MTWQGLDLAQWTLSLRENKVLRVWPDVKLFRQGAVGFIGWLDVLRNRMTLCVSDWVTAP